MIRLRAVVFLLLTLSAGATASLLPERAAAVEGTELTFGPATLTLDSGFLVPVGTAGEASGELVFVGRGRLAVATTDRVEAGQLRLFTRRASLDVEIERAVLVTGDPRSLLAKPATADPATLEQARELLESWVDSPERRGFGVQGARLRAAAEEPGFADFFAARFDTDELGRFHMIVDPHSLEQLEIGQFLPLDLDGHEEYKLERQIRKQQRRGVSVQTRLEDIGNWDTWMRASLTDEAGDPSPGAPSFEPVHYDLDVRLDTRALSIDAEVSVRLAAGAEGARVVTFSLFEDLTPSRITDDRGRALEWVQEGGEVHVQLADPVARGATVGVTIRYAGVILEKEESGVLALRSTHGWYPHSGTFDRATYDATFRRPKGFDLLASGELLSESTEGDTAVTRHRLDQRAFAFSFEIGKFKIVERQIGHVALRVAFSKSSMVLDNGARDEVVDTLEKSLAFYEARFGPYPLDYLTVVTVPRGFSQGFLSFLTLSHYTLALPANAWVVRGPADTREEQRRETVAHELAHQWWGNMVGWYNYRDQWLSEALATFSATTFMADRAEHRSAYLARRSDEWKVSLSRATNSGFVIESVGPVVLGERLFSSHTNAAYRAIVYEKGAMVFSMLARIIGEEPLCDMLGTLAQAVGHRVIDTDVFLRSLERMSGIGLESFSERFVYGTGIPEFYYRYDIDEDAETGFRISGRIQPEGRALHSCRLVRSERETWDVERTHAGNQNVDSLALVVPFQIVLDSSGDADDRKERRKSGISTGRGFGGSLILTGEGAEFSVPVPERPSQFWLDQRGEVLAHFYNLARAPKRAMRFRAEELTGPEKLDLLNRALTAELVSEDYREELRWSKQTVQWQSKVEDARIRLDIAEEHLDRGAYDEARAQLEQAERTLGPQHGNSLATSRRRIRARLASIDAKYESVVDTMRGEVWLDLPEILGVAQLRRRRWQQNNHGDRIDYALLAAAAFETGRMDIARAALDEAKRRGVDMGVLERELRE